MMPVNQILKFAKKNTVSAIAFCIAVVTSFIIHPDNSYLSYFDFKALTCLFCVLAVVCALRDINVFSFLARKIVRRFRTVKMCVLVLVYVTFIGSMLITNDMALITFLPLGFFVLQTAHKEKYLAFTFIMQNMAANLGGMLTPFGNPQNLYLYSKFNIPVGEFMMIMLPDFILSVSLITVCCLFIKGEPIEINDDGKKLDIPRTLIYFALFIFSIAIVFRLVPYIAGLIIIPVVLLFADRKALSDVDYPLLFTFVSFFVFSGNMSRMEPIRNFFENVLSKNTMLFSVLSCQVISNVPAAILLAQFTENYRDLLIGVNIGGLGTLIASLASLITLKEYTKHEPKKILYFIGMFSIFNFGFLAILLVFSLIFI